MFSQWHLGLGLSKLIIAVRNETKGQQARADLARTHSSLTRNAIEMQKLDMEDYASVTAFAEQAKALERLNIAVLNAGVAKTVYKPVNVLSTALLAILFLPILKTKSAASGRGFGRIAVVQSDTTFWAKFREKTRVPLLPALDDETTFARVDRYFASKLILQLFVTELTKSGGGTMTEGVIAVPNRILGRTPSEGSRVIMTAAVGFGPQTCEQYIEGGNLQPRAFI
ncbi:NAD(P)-binding protein [Apiospora hydei]|uniref:NAD(P)-binding protein n=1 Tax=Apiospora hydei TaxID=1337664 RepID=A0ABR1X8I2_9PEZI